MPTLDGAFALVQVDDMTVGVAKNLDLDVARALDIALDDERAVTKGRLGLAPRRGDALIELLLTPHELHALSASARARLEQEREADLERLLPEVRGILIGAIIARDDGQPALFGDDLCLAF